MKTKLNWEKKLFSNLCRIYSNDQLIGSLQYYALSRTAVGELNGKKYSFKTKGIFKVHTEIVDCHTNNVIGKITYNGWSTKAIILFDDKVFNWEYDNIWQKKWCLSNSEGIEILYSGSSLRGQVNSNIFDVLLLLIGLYIPKYFIDKIRRCA